MSFHPPHKSRQAHRIVKETLLAGHSIYRALLAANYSEKQARKGRKAIPDAVFELMTREELRAYESMGAAALSDPEQIERRIVGFLLSAMQTGQTWGLKAVELLGKHTGVLRLTEQQQMETRPLVIMGPSLRG